ncbi:retrovirus-related pol polyprotein from transposon TNT 1-94 [Tanacetum coccineum]
MVTTPAVPATEDSPEIPAKTSVETVLNMTPENKAHYESEKEAIHLILTGIGDEIYSTVDACQTAQEMWEAIGETIESYYTRFYKMMNEMIRNNLTVATMQVNVQFLQQLQPEWSRFVTIVKQQHKLDEVPYHKLFDILKQYQKEVNELRAERMAKNANPLALVATAQTIAKNPYKIQRQRDSKHITPSTESASEEDSDPEQAQTSSNTRNKNVDTNPRYKTDNQTGQFGNQRVVNAVGARETVGGPVVQQSGIQCFNCKEFGHYAKECRKPKRVRDSTYHKEKMLLCKQAEKGFNFKQANLTGLQHGWEIDEQELEAYYSYMAKIQEVPMQITGTDLKPIEQVETGDSNVIPDSPDMCNNDIQNDQHDVECDDERVALANLIANLKLDVDDNKKIQKQLKKANATLTQELTECKSILAETSRTLGESNSIRDSCLVALQNKQTEFERYKAFNDRTVDYDKLERKLNETLGLLAQKDIDIQEGLKVKAYEISVVQAKHDELVKQSLLLRSHYEGLVQGENQTPTFANPMYHKKAQYEHPGLYAITQKDQSDPAIRLIPDREEILTLAEESRSKLNKDLVKPFDYTKLNSLYEIFKPPAQHYEIQFAQANAIRKKIKSRQAYNVMTNNINHLNELVNQAWVKHSNDHLYLRHPTAQDMEILVKKCLMPLALKTQNDSLAFIHELKQEMHADLKYVESLEDELDELESDKAEFSNMYDMLLQECVSKDVMCSYLLTSSDLDEITELTLICTTVESELLGIIIPRVSTSTGVSHKSIVSRPQPRSNQLNDKVVPYTSHAKLKKTEVEEQPRISSISNKQIVQLILFIVDSGCTAYEGSIFDSRITSRSKGLLRRRFHSLSFSVGQFCDAAFGGCISGNIRGLLESFRERLYQRIKHLQLTAWLWHRRLSHSHLRPNKTAFKERYFDLFTDNEDDNTMMVEIWIRWNEKGDSCILVGYSTQSKGYRVYNKRTRLIVESIHLRFDEIKEMMETSVANVTSGLVPQRQKASDYDNPDPNQNTNMFLLKRIQTVPYTKELDFLFGLCREFFNVVDKVKSAGCHLRSRECTAMSSAEAEYVGNLPTEYQLAGFVYNALPEGKVSVRVRTSGNAVVLTTANWSSQAVNKSPTHYPCDFARTFRVILFSIHNDEWKSFQCHHQTALRRPYALSWKPCQGDSLNLPDHRIHKDGDGDASFQLKSVSITHALLKSNKGHSISIKD